MEGRGGGGKIKRRKQKRLSAPGWKKVGLIRANPELRRTDGNLAEKEEGRGKYLLPTG